MSISSVLVSGSSGKPTKTILVLSAFFISGMCGLIHEVAWTRLLRLVMGNGTFTITTVLCAFMGGLALGSYLGGRFVDRRGDELRLFALLEGMIGVYCLMLPWLITGAEPLYRFLYQNTAASYYIFGLIRFFFSGLILLIPAMFMGATLPILAKCLSQPSVGMGRSVGTLYAVNTFGAVFGVFLAGFLLIPELGVTRTIYLASFFNLLVGAAGFWLYKSTVKRAEPSLSEPTATPVTAHRIKAAGKSSSSIASPQLAEVLRTGLLWGYGLSGFAALVYEIAWTRALALLIGSTVYAFSLMLTAFVLGIAVGSLVFAPFADRVKRPMRTLVFLQAGIGLSAFLVVPVIGQLPFFVTGLIARHIGSFWTLQAAEFALCLGVMLIPTVLMGATFPLVNRLYKGQSAGVGTTVGNVYSANTIGNILGAFTGGFILIPLFGIQNTILTAVAANMLVSALFFFLATEYRPTLRVGVAIVLFLFTAAGIAVTPSWDPGRMSLGPYHIAHLLSRNSDLTRDALEKMESRNTVLFHKEGLTTTVTVKEVAKGVRALYIDGKPDASSHVDMAHQEMVAHVPLLFHKRPQSALVIGLASGISLGSVGRYPLERIDCVEISPEMVEASRYFDEFNYRIMEDPRVRIIIADGRNHLLLTDQQYDVIISQPSNPYLAGVADLFTREYFELARRRLNEGGVLCVWMQAYKMDLETFRSIIKTFHAVFPEMSFWRSGQSDCLLVGSKGPKTMDYHLLKQRFASAAIAADLKRIHIETVPDFLLHLVMGSQGVGKFAAPGRIHTDDNALVEFSAPRALTRTVLQLPLIEAIEDHREVDLRFLTYTGGVSAEVEELATVKKTTERFIAARAHLFRAYTLNHRNRAHEATEEIRRAVGLNPKDPMLKEFNAADHSRAIALAQGGQIDEAISLYQTMVQRIPSDEKAHYNLALALKLQGRLPEALHHYREAARLKPDYVVAIYNVGELSEQMGDIGTALTSYRKALEINPDLVPALNQLARLLAAHPDPRRRDPREAVRLAEKANRLTRSTNPYLLDTLSLAYKSAGRHEEAEAAAKQASQLTNAKTGQEPSERK